eukprot:COSAG01_NODE_491_length_16354_cov_26.550784_11_plen_70_part_00
MLSQEEKQEKRDQHKKARRCPSHAHTAAPPDLLTPPTHTLAVSVRVWCVCLCVWLHDRLDRDAVALVQP